MLGRMKTLLSWSTGKDSAWALHLLRQRDDVEVVGLVTTINAAFDRVAMHGVRRALVEAQAEAAGLPLHVLPIPYPCPNETYEAVMGEFVARQVAEGVQAMAFGDLFLEDIRRYRETKLAGTGIAPLFPVWGIETAQAGTRHDRRGLVAHIACLDPRKLPASLAGRRFDPRPARRSCRPVSTRAPRTASSTPLLSAGPMFRRPIPITVGEPVTRDGFVFCDLVPMPLAALRGESLRSAATWRASSPLAEMLGQSARERASKARRQPDRQRHRDRVRARPARLAGGAQPRVRLSGRRRRAAGADGAEIQGRGLAAPRSTRACRRSCARACRSIASTARR